VEVGGVIQFVHPYIFAHSLGFTAETGELAFYLGEWALFEMPFQLAAFSGLITV
jgi:hypothetical protein